MYPYFLEHISWVPNVGPVAKSAKAKQIVDPPSDPAGSEWEAPRAGRSGRGNNVNTRLPMLDDLSTTRPQTKGRKVAKLR